MLATLVIGGLALQVLVLVGPAPVAWRPRLAAAAPLVGRSWTELPVSDLATTTIADVLATPSGFIAVGYDQFNVSYLIDVAGLDWSGPGSWPPGKAAASSVAAGDRGFAAVGSILEGAGWYEAWTSADGARWRSAPMPEGAEFWEITAIPGAYLVVGGFETEDGSSQPASWTSGDGTTWTRISPEASLPEFTALLPTEHGALAIGRGLGPGQEGQVWRFADGGWGDAPLATIADSDLSVIARSRETLVLAGQECTPDCRPRLWRSEDGTAWEPVDSVAPPTALSRILGHPSGFIGTEADGEDLWLSSDGIAWERVRAPWGKRYTTLAAGHGRVLALSVVGGLRPRAWISSTDAPDSATVPRVPGDPARSRHWLELTLVASFLVALTLGLLRGAKRR